jgi:hypothetical protein
MWREIRENEKKMYNVKKDFPPKSSVKDSQAC